jgi:hypothetical protein
MDAIANRVATGLAAQRASAAKIAELMAAYDPRPTEQAAEGESPAVIKTISSEGQESVRAAWNKLLEERGYGHLANMSSEERGERVEAYVADVSRRMQLSVELRQMQFGRDNLAENERVYAKMSASEPVPPKQLQGEELEAAFKLMDKLGIARSTFGHDTSIFLNEGTRYIFHRDGRLEAHDADIAPSREEKTLWLSGYARQIEYGRADPTASQAEYDALTTRIEATKAELFRNR